MTYEHLQKGSQTHMLWHIKEGETLTVTRREDDYLVVHARPDRPDRTYPVDNLCIDNFTVAQLIDGSH